MKIKMTFTLGGYRTAGLCFLSLELESPLFTIFYSRYTVKMDFNILLKFRNYSKETSQKQIFLYFSLNCMTMILDFSEEILLNFRKIVFLFIELCPVKRARQVQKKKSYLNFGT